MLGQAWLVSRFAAMSIAVVALGRSAGWVLAGMRAGRVRRLISLAGPFGAVAGPQAGPAGGREGVEVEGLPDRLVRPCSGLRVLDEPFAHDGPGRIGCLLVAVASPMATDPFEERCREISKLAATSQCAAILNDSLGHAATLLGSRGVRYDESTKASFAWHLPTRASIGSLPQLHTKIRNLHQIRS